ncbi:DUF4188 domain-containing protein [Solirubrobacter sp. CPCC 204708]|uniref:DUF4188 domain-containing protein n=1 Tax=Solirubrobacter deserti TaxID=2282478 RepID=A0ABT4RQ33_9ACTN|nr:DUF4188 domain-containing protein [Solirubrobacter deserti]MBE2320613.1 DUF4188 domain-containing protein [Solirubrobacter deserti]MDA0140667.1 DUF4188 domain-containing protein [Solirubrobacter deserti]
MPTGWTIRDTEDDGVQFLIGMRWGALWRLAYRPWVAHAFVRMLRASPESGLEKTWLSVRPAGPVVVQRWQSAADLRRWARDHGEAHAEPWRRFRQEIGGTADWGVWHDVRTPRAQEL